MRRLALLLALVALPALGQVTIVGSDTVKPACTLGALNAACTVRLAGQANVGLVVTGATSPVLTLTPELSFDGTNWVATTFDDPSTWLKTASQANPTVGMTRTLMPGGGSLQARVRVSAYTSGSCVVQLAASTMQDPSEGFSGPAGALGVPPAMAYIAARDATTATTGNPLQSGLSNAVAEFPGLHTLPGVARSSITAATAGRATALTTDSVTGFQLVSIADGTTFSKVTAGLTGAVAVGVGMSVEPAVARATPTASTVGNTAYLQIESVTGALYVSPVATTAATGTSAAIVSVNTATNVKASAGNVYGVSCANANASVCFLQFYNTAGAPTCGTSVTWSLAIPTSGTLTIPPEIPMVTHATGIGVCMGTTATGATACTTANACTIFFK